ncbi:hypothetical protein ACFVY1_40980 [Streptomyces sp. NPDC058293]|uniref:hypothetical protein n=1 Tax=Streptomyces sp. NPDC058293 TaxID=3346429 RepID=UPI0036E38414
MTRQSVPVAGASAVRRGTVLGGLGAGVALAAASGSLNTAAAAGRGSSSGDGCRASVTYRDKQILISVDAG